MIMALSPAIYSLNLNMWFKLKFGAKGIRAGEHTDLFPASRFCMVRALCKLATTKMLPYRSLKFCKKLL